MVQTSSFNTGNSSIIVHQASQPCPPPLRDSACSCSPFSFHQPGGQRSWGHCSIASVATSALYLSSALIHIRWMSVSYVRMKLQTKRISPTENLICTHLKYNRVLLLMADEVLPKYITATPGEGFLSSWADDNPVQLNVVNLNEANVSNRKCKKRRPILHKRCCYCSLRREMKVRNFLCSCAAIWEKREENPHKQPRLLFCNIHLLFNKNRF